MHSGSPPHTRGKAHFREDGNFINGITPAYAGKGRMERVALSVSGDHPRIRGERRHSPGIFYAVLGSPPHTRGKAGRFSECDQCRGITPAYAGKGRFRPREADFCGDHPRIRGERTKKSPKIKAFLPLLTFFHLVLKIVLQLE